MSDTFLPKHWWANVIGALSFFLTGFCGLVIWDTLKDDSQRIVMQDGIARGHLAPDGTLVVTYTRGFMVKRAGDGILQRKVTCICPKGSVDEFDLPNVQRHFEATVYPAVTRWLETPIKVAPGSTCTLHVWGSWRHRFAISAKHYLLDTMDFKVEAPK